MTPRHPGYDIDGQPTKVDPRDWPDPLQVDPDGEPQRGDPPRPARGDWGCSVFGIAVAALGAVFVWWRT